MTTDRKIAANRRNSSRSRGPATAAGKMKSRGNALRHGLTAAVLLDPALRHEVDKLARAIAGQDADPSRLALAREIAEAQLDLGRAANAKVALLDPQFSGMLQGRASEAGIAGRSLPARRAASVEDASHGTQPRYDPGLTVVLHQLERLTRYERGAMLRRRRATRAFILHEIG